MNANNIITLNEAIATTLADEPGDGSSFVPDLEGSIGLAAIQLAGFTWQGRRCEFGEYLRMQNAPFETVGVIGMNPIGQAIVQQARLGFGLEVLCADVQPVLEFEDAYDARIVSVNEVLRGADLICFALPLPGRLVRQITRHYMALKSAHTIGIAWRRCQPVERAAIYLGKDYTNCIPLDDLAAMAGLSKFRLARKFSATLGITAHRFQLLLRVFHARSLLYEGVEIGEIAYRLGFSDQSHFGRCFRSIAGMTPGQYQKMVLHDEELSKSFCEFALQANLENIPC